MKYVTFILVLVLILGVIGISGCTDSTSSNHTKFNQPVNQQPTTQNFSDGGITLTYPISYENFTPGEPITSGSSDWKWILNTTENSTGNAFFVCKNDNMKSYTPDSVVQADMYQFNSMNNGQMLSNTKITVNNVKISKYIATLKDPNTNGDLKEIMVYFKDNDGTMYQFEFIGNLNSFDSVQKTANDVLNSIRVQ